MLFLSRMLKKTIAIFEISTLKFVTVKQIDLKPKKL